MIERKHVNAEVKALPQDGPGIFEAYVSVFGNVDSVGDVMIKGAFERTLMTRGLPPIVWSHQWEMPPIGKSLAATEDVRGLLVKGQLFIDDNDTAREVYVAMREGALREFSFAFEVMRSNMKTLDDGSTVREITDVELYEVGPTLVGANPETSLVGIKNAVEVKEPYKPNETMAREAQRGLDWRDEYGRGGTAVGIARARDIAGRRNLSLDTIGRMVSFFARHEVDKQGQGWSPDEDGYPSNGRIAWALWGGDPGRSWANAIWERDGKSLTLPTEDDIVDPEPETEPEQPVVDEPHAFTSLPQSYVDALLERPRH